jgi:hypothetical protein
MLASAQRFRCAGYVRKGDMIDQKQRPCRVGRLLLQTSALWNKTKAVAAHGSNGVITPDPLDQNSYFTRSPT